MNKYNKNQRKYQVPIRVAVALFPIILIFFVLVPTAYFLIQNAERAGENEARHALEDKALRVQEYLQSTLTLSQQINSLNVNAVRQGSLDDHSAEILQQYFLNQVQTFDTVSSIYFGNPQGGLADAGREPADASYYLIGTEDFSAGDFYKYAIDEDGNPEELLLAVPDFDARTRGWYRNAVEKGDALWSDVYILFTGHDLAISASRPVYDKSGEFLGVVANDIFLSQLSDFLERQPVGKTGESFVMERSGLLIASSEKTALFIEEEEGVYERIGASDSESLLIHATADALAVQFSSLETIQSANQFDFFREGERYFVDIRPITDPYGLDWLAVVVLAEADFREEVIADFRAIFSLFALLAFFSLLLEFFGSRWISFPLVKLNQAVKNFSEGNWKGISDTARLKEVSQLTVSFNAMAASLGETFDQLNAKIIEHKQAEDNLTLSEARYRSVVEDSPGLLCGFLPSGEITFANKCYAEYYQTTPEALVGTNFLELLHEDDRNVVMAKIYSLSQKNPSSTLTQRTINPDGEIRHQRWVNRALFADSGEVIAYQSFGEDIEEEYKIQQFQSALYRIVQAANRAQSLEYLYPAIHAIIAEMMPAENFYIALHNPSTDRLEMVYLKDEIDPTLVTTTKKGLTFYVYHTGNALLATAAQLEAMQESGKIARVGAPAAIWLGVPLMTEGRILGVLAVQDYHNSKAFNSQDKEFLEMVSSPVAALIARQMAEEETLVYAQINALLFKAAQEISETFELSTLYRTLYAIIIEVMDCDFMMVSSFDPEEKLIHCAHLMLDGEKQDISEYPPLELNPEGQGTQSMVIRTGKPILIKDYLAQIQASKQTYYIDPDGNLNNSKERPKDDENITRSALLVPLMLEGKVIGVIQVMSYQLNAYSEADLHLLEALSSHIAIASNNARLYQQAQDEIRLRSEAEEELQGLNLELEARVAERTAELDQRIKIAESLNLGMSNILSDLNAANAIAEKNARELRDANVELEAFTHSVSHDLRAPLRHIESFSHLLDNRLDETLDETSSRYLQNIIASTERMRTLIEDLLILSHTNRADLHLKPLDFNAIIESVRAQLFDEVEERQIMWKIASLPPAQADAGLMKILWENLIGNAVKYTRPREEAIIEIGILPSEKQTVYFIRDNGVGFAPEYQEQLFGVFQRLHKSEEFEGSGVGLATVKRIIERHGGKIWSEGEIDQGATFYFSLGVQ